MALKNHYLGAGHADAQATKAEQILRTTKYHGETRRWNFERYAKRHKDQHTILDELHDRGLHNGIDGATKVRYLMGGISGGNLDTISGQILADAVLKQNFDQCVNLYKQFIQQKRLAFNDKKEVTVASVQQQRGGRNNGRGGGDVKPDMSVPLRYYKNDEYRNLSPAQKLGPKRKREQSKTGKSDSKQVSWDQATISALAAEIKAFTTDDTEEGDVEDGEEDGEKQSPKRQKIQGKGKGGNRSNSALQR